MLEFRTIYQRFPRDMSGTVVECGLFTFFYWSQKAAACVLPSKFALDFWHSFGASDPGTHCTATGPLKYATSSRVVLSPLTYQCSAYPTVRTGQATVLVDTSEITLTVDGATIKGTVKPYVSNGAFYYGGTLQENSGVVYPSIAIKASDK